MTAIQSFSLEKMVLPLAIVMVTAMVTGKATVDNSLLPFGVCKTDYGEPTTAFKQSLSILFDSLVSNASRTGFATGSIGRKPDQAYGLLMCYGDASVGECKQCVSNAYAESPCGTSVTWFEHCMVLYARTNFTGIVDTARTAGWSRDSVSDPVLFDQKVRSLIYNLTSKVTANESRGMMFAYGDVPFKGDLTIHGLAQCTRDISLNDCSSCLANLTSEPQIGECCSGRPDVFMATQSCIIRYRVPQLPPSSSTSPATASCRNLFRDAVLIVITSSIVAAAALHL